MSIVYDKGKHRNSTDKNSSKLKLSNNNPINHLNIPKNNNKKNIPKNTPIFSEYISSSPLGNNNRKKKQFLTTFQNIKENNNNNNISNTNDINNKRPQIKKLNFNKSFEGNFGRDNFSKNFDLIKEGIYKGKNNENKKAINKSVIINHKKKSNKSTNRTIKANNTLNHKKNNLGKNLLIKKLEEKFKSLENNIIDKKYENEIDHEEIILSSMKNNNYPYTTRVKNKEKEDSPLYKLSNMIEENIEEDNFINIILNKLILNDSLYLDEYYLLNSSFENNRNDFNIMYTDNYEQSVMDDMLSLEIKLLLEKMLDIQKSYHKELKIIHTSYKYNSQMMKLFAKKIKNLQKKIFLVKKIKEEKEITKQLENEVDIYNYNNQHGIYKINKDEFNLWNYIIYEQKKKIIDDKKEKLKEIFKKIIFERYYKIKGKINDIENKIILNLMKKYNYNLKRRANGVKSNNIANVSIPNQWQNKNKNTNVAKKHKALINNNINNNVNNRKKHKKTSSCIQTKPAKYTYFKNNQKPK